MTGSSNGHGLTIATPPLGERRRAALKAVNDLFDALEGRPPGLLGGAWKAANPYAADLHLKQLVDHLAEAGVILQIGGEVLGERKTESFLKKFAAAVVCNIVDSTAKKPNAAHCLVADVVGVTPKTVKNWCRDYTDSDFARAVGSGDAVSDAQRQLLTIDALRILYAQHERRMKATRAAGLLSHHLHRLKACKSQAAADMDVAAFINVSPAAVDGWRKEATKSKHAGASITMDADEEFRVAFETVNKIVGELPPLAWLVAVQGTLRGGVT